jgi:membrane associated rhomboid family serine protease
VSDNPRLILAAFWLMAGLRSFAAAGDSHTTVVLIGNLFGVVAGPVLGYFELRQGLADRRARLAAQKARRP